VPSLLGALADVAEDIRLVSEFAPPSRPAFCDRASFGPVATADVRSEDRGKTDRSLWLPRHNSGKRSSCDLSSGSRTGTGPAPGLTVALLGWLAWGWACSSSKVGDHRGLHGKAFRECWGSSGQRLALAGAPACWVTGSPVHSRSCCPGDRHWFWRDTAASSEKSPGQDSPRTCGGLENTWRALPVFRR